MDNYIFLALIISFLWGIQTVIHKYLLTKYNWITLLFSSGLIHFILVAFLSLLKSKELISDLNKTSSGDAVIMISVPLFTVFITQVIYLYILKDNESSIISALICSSPFFTLIFAYLFLKERLDIYGISGIFAIVMGVVLISQNNKVL
jgi:drug/metabolite transporter (DMT)-like permease